MAGFEKLFGFVAALCCGLFAGAALYLNLVEHPVRMECRTELAATEFPPSYRRATVLQVSLAHCRRPSAVCHSLYTHLHFADKQPASRRFARSPVREGAFTSYSLGSAPFGSDYSKLGSPGALFNVTRETLR